MDKKKIQGRSFVLSLLLALLCALAVIFLRNNSSTVIRYSFFDFAYTDIFVIIASAIGGLETGLMSFVFLFLGETIRPGRGNGGLFSVVTYLLLVLVGARLAYKGRFRKIKDALFSATIFALVLASNWYLNFNVLANGDLSNNTYYGSPIYKLFIDALPESLIACLIIYLYFRFMPDNVKMMLGSGWIYTREGKNHKYNNYVLGTRLSVLSFVEAFVLCIVAIIVNGSQIAETMNRSYDLEMFLSRWKDDLRMGLLMLCAAIPVIYLLNEYIMLRIIDPIDRMSLVMDKYFESDDHGNISKLPDLNIHSGDEIENLYHSMQNMVKEMSDYINRMIEQEKKSAHLTQGFMLALAKAVDAKDRYTSGHSIRVANYAKEVARRLGYSEKKQEDIYSMGLLHDIGKIGVPEAIINKNGRLTDEEFATIKTHPVIGYDILKNVKELPELATGARWHHERYDGKGYPDGLSGKDIPEEARIIAIADAYDAMTSNRAYSSIRPQQAVREEILRCKGTQFDPELADIFISIIDDDKEYRMKENRKEDI